MMILVESNIIVLGLARMNVCIVGEYSIMRLYIIDIYKITEIVRVI